MPRFAFDGEKRPLVMLSHGRGSTGLSYAWFASPTVASGRYQTRHRLPAQRSRLEQICRCLPHRRRRPQPRRLHGALARPRQGQSRQVPHLPAGVAQQSANSPAHPGRAAARPRARAQRKGRPRQGGVCHGSGIIKAFGMDEAGLRQLDVPAYITVGATPRRLRPRTPSSRRNTFRTPSSSLSQARSTMRSSSMNATAKCKDEFPEACKDATGVDRAAIHDSVGNAALKFFGTALGQ